jgi:excinuclease ABC subunit B
MRRAIDETDRRREKQRAYNEENGITPQSILSKLENSLAAILKAEYGDPLEEAAEGMPEFGSQEELDKYLTAMEAEMREAAKKFEFEKAARLRDTIRDLRAKEFLFG